MFCRDDYGYRYNRRLSSKDALDHIKQRWKPKKELIKHVRKLKQQPENEKTLHFHVDYSVFWEYFHFNKRSEYRLHSKWAHKVVAAKSAYIYAAFNKSGDGECKLKFNIEAITKFNNLDVTNDAGFRVISSEPVLKIDFGECVEAVLHAETMNNIVKEYWKSDKNQGSRLYNFDLK